MKDSSAALVLAVSLTVLFATPSSAQTSGRRILRSQVPAAARLHFLKSLAETNHLNLAIGLPLRNPEALTNLLRQLYDPATPNFHQWLTPEQFAGQFGPTEADYQKVIHFAEAHGLKITRTHSNRLLLDVTGATTNLESAFQVKLRVYQHPAENRTFYAPDAEPSVETNVPILCVGGLDNYILPHRLGGGIKPASVNTNQGITAYATGSGPGGDFTGKDFRAAYVHGVTNTGAGQYIAIVDVGGPYYTNDIYKYETNAGLSTSTVVTNILLSGWTGIPTGSSDDDGEETLDIDMAMSMAPGATILNYEGEAHAVFNQIAIDNKAKQMTLSYGFGIDASIIQMFQEFAAQGQEFSQASGDGGADLDGGTGLTGNPYATIVGGTDLNTSGAGGPWQSETAWAGSGGGISGYGIPNWQQGIATTANLGSTTYRNYPDVAMLANPVIWWYFKNGQGSTIGGTSAASPLWAGFMALVNQQAATLGKPSVGFVNPAIYAIGKGPSSTYSSCFHDIITGNTLNGHNATKYYARAGYDLCTGWGTPTGSNTINALAGAGTNDFFFYPSQGGFNLVAGASANAAITLTRMNGLTGSATFSTTGLPAGITAVISPASTATTVAMTITTRTNTLPGSYSATLTGTMGSLTHSATLNFVIIAPIPGAMQVNLASYYNRAGIYSDGRTFSTGLDGSYSSYSANLLGATLSWNGLVFTFGPSNALNVVNCASQTITLPAGRFNTLQILATAVQGSQAAQTFTITYTDNSTATFKQSFSDWASPQSYSGESTGFTMPYRDLNTGGTQTLNVNVDGYTFNLDQTKTVKSITLPGNSNLILLSAMLANDPVSAPLASYYNRAGIYTDGATFTNPATGGLDGGGYAYSGTLLGGSQAWSNTVFNFGPVNATNVISAASQTISLPGGNDAVLRMLATGVLGGQVSQSFVVTYTDSTTTTFVQSLSDWFTPSTYPGESKAIIMGHRNSSNGSADNRIFYLYGYSFVLNPAKTIQSIRLPNNGNVIVTAISLVPNWTPVFTNNSFTEAGITAGQAYSGTISASAMDLNGGALTFAKVSGPGWLGVAANGSLAGTPLSSDVGTNSFVVSVTDPGGLSSSATMIINVSAAPPIISSISFQGADLLLSWTGGIAPYQVLMTTNLANPNWANLGTPVGNSLTITPSNDATWYRIIGQ